MVYEKVRLILTLDCPRRCEYCCNKFDSIMSKAEVISDLRALEGCKEVMLTGGEIALYDGLLPMIARVRDVVPDAKIYLYSALFNKNLKEAIKRTHGTHYSLHANLNWRDIERFDEMQSFIRLWGKDMQSFRCYLHPDIAHPVPLQPSLWDDIKYYRPLSEKDLYEYNAANDFRPKGEKLMIWRN